MINFPSTGGYSEFWSKNHFFIFAKFPSYYARLIYKVPRNQDFFPVLKKNVSLKKIFFFVSPNSDE